MLAAGMLLVLSGCQVMEQTNEEQTVPFSESNEQQPSSAVITGESSAVGDENADSVSDTEKSNTDITASTASNTENSVSNTEKPVATPEPTAPAETAKHTEKPAQTSKPTEQPTAEPEKATPQPTEKPMPEPPFDINYWISYAKSYAESSGLVLDSTATECWDNPISAGANCTSIESNIKSRINRYAKDENTTAVWIWAESPGNGSYDLYIGYT